jgi:predicted NUDIX family NTP pyrophosphohydrolase
MATSKRTSAALLVYRFRAADKPMGARLEVLLGHMGGPFWAKKDAAGWSIPKGEYEPPEDPMAAALREFEEELGSPAPDGPYLDLGTTRLSSGKIITTFAVQGDFDAATMVSNTFELEWPPRSGRIQAYPELDRAAWFTLDEAAVKLVKGQLPILEALRLKVSG